MSHMNPGTRKLSRRKFLRTITVLGTGLAAACSSKDSSGMPTPYKTPTRAQILESPVAPVTGVQGEMASPTIQVQVGSMTFDQFMQFSSLLTGVDNLSPELGQVYFQTLQAGAKSGSALSAAYAAASSVSNTLPKDTAALSQSGFFEKEGMNDLAIQIADMWYSGVYNLNGEDHVATFVDALAWKVLHFTKPPTICGEFGFWATEPEVQISPTIQYTPVPTPAQSNP
jgi:hypothetical protein